MRRLAVAARRGLPSTASLGTSAASSTVATNAATITNDGSDTATISVVIKDVAGAGVSGVTPTMTATGTGNTIGSFSATDSNGASSATFKTTGASAHIITVTASGRVLAQTVTVTASGAASTADPTKTTIAVTDSALGTLGTTTVTVQAKDASNVNLSASGGAVTLSADVGTVGAVTDHNDGTYTATFTAAASVGIATITGTIAGQAITTTAPTVTVTVNHEPASYSLLAQREFNAKVEQGWTDRGDAAFTLESDTSAPLSPNNVGQALFATGFAANGIAPILLEYALTPTNQSKLFIAFPFKVSSNWQGHDSGINKVFHFLMGGASCAFLQLQGSGSNSLFFRANTQSPGDDFSFGQTANGGISTECVRDTWYYWEALLEANAVAGAFTGRFRSWVTGPSGTVAFADSNIEAPNQLSHQAGVCFWDGSGSHPTGFWRYVRWNPTWGGAGVNTVAADMYQRIDRIYLSSHA